MRARDARPRAARVELDVALPVKERIVRATGARQRGGEVEVRVRVVGRELEREPVLPDRQLDVAAVFVERSEVVGGLAEMLVLRVMEETMIKRGITGELSMTLEDNFMVNRFVEAIGAQRYKTYRIFKRTLT